MAKTKTHSVVLPVQNVVLFRAKLEYRGQWLAQHLKYDIASFGSSPAEAMVSFQRIWQAVLSYHDFDEGVLPKLTQRLSVAPQGFWGRSQPFATMHPDLVFRICHRS